MTRLPQGWEIVRFEEMVVPDAPIIYGILQPGPEYPEGVKYVRPTEIQDGSIDLSSVRRTSPEIAAQYERSKLAAGDVILSIVGTIGKVALVPDALEGANITQSSCRLRPDRNLTGEQYLQHFLKAPQAVEQYDRKRMGTAVPRLNLADVRQFEIPLSPLPEQRRIVRKLGTLSARSTTARTHLTAIEKLVPRHKLAVLRSAFAGELTASFRAKNVLEAVSDLLMRVPAPQQGRGGRQATSAVKAGLGGISVNVPDVDLPEHWDWVPLLRVARQETGHTPSRSRPDWWDGDVCWMSIPDANLHHGRVIYDTIQKTNEEGLANSSARLLPPGTVVLSRTASVGYICILGKDMATSQDFATWTCTDALLPEYMMYALLSEGEDIKKFGEGSTHTTIYFPEIRAFHIKLAPIEEQHEIVRRIKVAFAKIDRLAIEAAKALKLLGHLDQRILAKAFAGELVPQDPTDEPAETLLARIRAARSSASKPKRGRKKRAV